MTTARHWHSIRLALLVAFLIAGTAFALGQFAPGAGMVFAIAAGSAWVSYSLARQRRYERRAGG